MVSDPFAPPAEPPADTRPPASESLSEDAVVDYLRSSALNKLLVGVVLLGVGLLSLSRLPAASQQDPTLVRGSPCNVLAALLGVSALASGVQGYVGARSALVWELRFWRLGALACVGLGVAFLAALVWAFVTA